MPEMRISHYRVVRKIGAGGMGEVLLAEDLELERRVAIKLMSAELAKDPVQRRRFRSEAKSISGLDHPNICIIHEVGETDDGRPFLAMEYIEGQTLDVILRQRRLKMREVVSIGLQIAEALDAAHARNLIHRDIKPANIMIDRQGRAKVLDFGLAKRVATEELGANTTVLTRTGFIIGTPHYMSPEQVLGRELDTRSDLFSVGVILYELAAGQRPFLAKTIGETLNLIVNQQPEPLGLDNPAFSPALDKIVFKCLEKDPQNRYGSAHELAVALRNLQTQTQPAAPSVAESLGSPAVRGGKDPAAGRHQFGMRGKLPALAGLCVIVLSLLTWVWLHPHRQDSAGSRRNSTLPGAAMAKSVAVLPFDNFSQEKDSDYLSDGLTEEITATLARVPGLRVAARNSAFAFKTRKEDLRKVGAMLGVATLLEGSLRKSGNRVRVTAQLISAVDGLHLWADSYDANLGDILTVQENIAGRIAENFQLKPSTAATGSSHATTSDQETYALYLKGLHVLNKRTKEDLERAGQLFNQAIDKDPTYAAAYAGLASTYALLPDYNSRPLGEYFPLARAAAEKALKLDPESADAYAVLGLVSTCSREYARAEEQFQHAIRLNPNHSSARHWYGVLLRSLNRMDEAGLELKKAQELDPLSPIIQMNVLIWMGINRQYTDGLEQSERYLQTFPDFALFHSARALFFQGLGRHQEAVAEILTARAAFTNAPYCLGFVGYIYGCGGETNNARKVLAELEDWKKRGYAVREDIALVHTALGEFDLASDSFEEALANGEPLEDVLVAPFWDGLRRTPRFQAFLRKLGLTK